MKDKAVPPRDDSTRNGAMAKTVTCNEERGGLGEDPYEYKIQDVDIIA